jgi:hypothetical protein
MAVKEFLALCERKNHRNDLIRPLHCGQFILSIQGSKNHYCNPREDIHPSLYTHMELAIFPLEKGKVVRPVDLAGFARYSELLEQLDGDDEYEGYRTSVYGYVPIDLIEDIYVYLSNLKP